MAWTVETKKPVEIIGMKGHWQAKDVDGPYLCGSGWDVWECEPEGYWHNSLSLKEAMKHFLEANPWAKK